MSTKVKLRDDAETPSQSIINTANQTVIVDGINGNQYTLKKILRNVREMFLDMLGKESAENFIYVGSMLPYLAIKRIDDEDIAFPRNKMQLNALSQRIPDEDYEAIVAKIDEMGWFGTKNVGNDELKKS